MQSKSFCMFCSFRFVVVAVAAALFCFSLYRIFRWEFFVWSRVHFRTALIYIPLGCVYYIVSWACAFASWYTVWLCQFNDFNCLKWDLSCCKSVSSFFHLVVLLVVVSLLIGCINKNFKQNPTYFRMQFQVVSLNFHNQNFLCSLRFPPCRFYCQHTLANCLCLPC